MMNQLPDFGMLMHARGIANVRIADVDPTFVFPNPRGPGFEITGMVEHEDALYCISLLVQQSPVTATRLLQAGKPFAGVVGPIQVSSNSETFRVLVGEIDEPHDAA